jgi:hypothetical protein
VPSLRVTIFYRNDLPTLAPSWVARTRDAATKPSPFFVNNDWPSIYPLFSSSPSLHLDVDLPLQQEAAFILGFLTESKCLITSFPEHWSPETLARLFQSSPHGDFTTSHCAPSSSGNLRLASNSRLAMYISVSIVDKYDRQRHRLSRCPVQ